MIRWFFRKRIAAFERDTHYDASYMKELIDVSPSAFMRYGLVTSLGDLPGAPDVAKTAAAVFTIRTEDCGPCTQLGIDLAAKRGIPAATLRAILEGDLAAMGDDASLAYRFARASLAHSIEADALRDEIVSRWGKPGLVSIAMAMMAVRTYPTLKYALGYGKACTRIEVEGAPVKLAELRAA